MAETIMHHASEHPSAPPAPSAATADAPKRRSFRGLSLEERQQQRRDKLVAAGLQVYGTQGFLSVTVRDVCQEAKLTERYFYESFKNREHLFKFIYLQLVETLQQHIMNAMVRAVPEAKAMADAALVAFLQALKDDPRMARILFVDVLLVHELHGTAIKDAVTRFDRMTLAFIEAMLPEQALSAQQLSLVSTGLNGYVTHIAIRWVMDGFREPLEDVLAACRVLHFSLIDRLLLTSTTPPAD